MLTGGGRSSNGCPEAPPKEQLVQAACWFARTDRVAGRSDITGFRQWARLHQSEWRESCGYPLGGHRKRDGELVPNGSKLEEDRPMSEDFRNFLSEPIRAAVAHRLSCREKHQQLDEKRLRLDLLSSMPMCFNLFGELHYDRARLMAAGSTLFGIDTPGREVRFEFSPARRDSVYTGDGTAFDVALLFGEAGRPGQIVGIETKYHEHAAKEKAPRPDRLARYTAITERAREEGVFRSGWRDLLGTELQQVWRDHLLLLSMLQHQDGSLWSAGKYVLVHPACNPAYAEVGERYRTEILDDDSTFEVRTIEELLDAHVLLSPDTEARFRERYLF